MNEEKPSVRQIIVVEGRYDKAAVLAAVNAVVIETGGFSVLNDRSKASHIRALAQKRGVILLTDSDSAGQVIRQKLKGMLGTVEIRQAYTPVIPGKERRKRSPSKENRLGVEGMEPELLREIILRCADTEEKVHEQEITKTDFFLLGLSGPGSADRRKTLAEHYRLPENITANALLESLNVITTLSDLKKTCDLLFYQPSAVE